MNEKTQRLLEENSWSIEIYNECIYLNRICKNYNFSFYVDDIDTEQEIKKFSNNFDIDDFIDKASANRKKLNLSYSDLIAIGENIKNQLIYIANII